MAVYPPESRSRRAQVGGITGMKKVTIIIPNYNGRELLKNCLRSLERQTFSDFKVLVVDNGSSDGSVSLTSGILDLEYIRLKENRGFCGAVNIGIAHTKTPYLILLNNDTEAEESFVEKLCEAIEASDRIFSCGARVMDYRNRSVIDSAGDYYTAFGWAVSRGKGKEYTVSSGSGKQKPRFSAARNVFSCCAAAAIYRTKAVKRLNGLDPHHFAYLEDVDLGYRAKIYGYENRYEPTAVVYHVGSATTGTRYNEKKVFLSARNTIYVLYKNMPVPQILLNLPFILAGMVIKTVFFAKKDFAFDYLKGIGTGIATCMQCPKVAYQRKNFRNYVRIQFELWFDIVRVLFQT